MRKLLLILISITLLQAVPSVTAYFQIDEKLSRTISTASPFSTLIIFSPGTVKQYSSDSLATTKEGSQISINYGSIPDDASIVREALVCLLCSGYGYYDKNLEFADTFSIENKSNQSITLTFSSDPKILIEGSLIIGPGQKNSYSISFKVGTKGGTSLNILGLLGINLFSEQVPERPLGLRSYKITTTVSAAQSSYNYEIPLAYEVVD